MVDIQHRLLAFKRRYYLNKIVKGLLVLLLLVLALFTALVLAESMLWMGVGARTSLFFLLLAAAGFVLVRSVVLPTLGYFRLGATLNEEAAARMIGQHFPEVRDRLLNLLQLGQAASAQEYSLLRATIEERTASMQHISFARAISFRANWRFARLLAVPLMVLAVFLVINPLVLYQSSTRIFRYATHFVPPPPFEILVSGHPERMMDGASATIRIKARGRQIPDDLFIYIQKQEGGSFISYPLLRDRVASYHYTLENMHGDFSYYIGNEGYGSRLYETRVLRRPELRRFRAVVFPPAYTGLAPETMPDNVGDFNVLRGSTVRWLFDFNGPVDKAFIALGDKREQVMKTDAGGYLYERTVLSNLAYSLQLQSVDGIQNQDTLGYRLTVSPDRYPSVRLVQPETGTDLPGSGFVLVLADATDDYGLSGASLSYRFVASKNPAKVSDSFKSLKINLLNSIPVQSLRSEVDFFALGAEQGDELELYVTVWDNDQISGPKSANSSLVKLSYQSVQSLYEEAEKDAANWNASTNELIQRNQRLQSELEQVQEKILSKQQLGYEDRQQIRQLVQQQQQILSQLEENRKKLNEQRQNAESQNLYTPETLQKLEELEQLMEQMDPEALQRIMQELEKNSDKMSQQELKNKLDAYKQEAEELQKSIERTLELFKQLEIAQKVEELIKRLDELEARQQLLEDKVRSVEESKQSRDSRQARLDSLAREQDGLTKEMQGINKELGELKDKKATSQTPDETEMKELEQLGKEAQQSQQDASEQLRSGKPKSGAQQQQQSQQQMQQMQQQLNDMQQQAELEQQQENYDDLRSLLENLLTLSFEQEELRDEVKALGRNDAGLVRLSQEQRKLADDMQMIDDSLRALSGRVFEIKAFVIERLAQIDKEFDRANTFFAERRTPMGVASQHEIMKNLNELANMLTEALQQMQQQMQQMKGQQSKMCKNPNASGMGKMQQQMQQMGKMQGELNKQMEQQRQSGQGSMDELARRQEEIRRRMQQLMQQMEGQGDKGLGSLQKVAEDMQQTEEDLRKQQLTSETLARQQRILSRMLDFDKSIREREFEEQREGKTAFEDERVPPQQLSQDELQQRIRKELYYKNKYEYTRSYRQLIESYFNLLE
ncbi:MAG: hypothetical protein LW884_04645 [Bacteroidetes bacterium]|jgi:hypothetical protein|nr:hypothetical protein [Bacteroidota bacterium]